jgi:DNA-binding SARP family transcriptional activator
LKSLEGPGWDIGVVMTEDGLFIGLLGPPLVRRDGAEVRIASGKQWLLLGALAVAGRALSRDELIDVLWGGEPPATAVGTLQTHVSRLRTSIGSGTVVEVGAGYRLEINGNQLDSDAFAAGVGEARAARDRGGDEAARRGLRSALFLWRGPALATFRYEPFAQLEIARLEALRLEAIEDRCELVSTPATVPSSPSSKRSRRRTRSGSGSRCC